MTTEKLKAALRAHGVDTDALAAHFAAHPVANPEAALRSLAVTLSRALRRGDRIANPTAYLLALAERYV